MCVKQDHNSFWIHTARDAGLIACTSVEILASYLPYIRPRGRVVFITAQERGFASDSTHIAFSDHSALERLGAA